MSQYDSDSILFDRHLKDEDHLDDACRASTFRIPPTEGN